MAVEAYRTPDERFEELPGYPFEPRYSEVDGLRIARVDEGEGPPVIFFHGEPTWSYPTPESKAGARAFPLMLPTSPDMPGAAAGKRVLEALRSDQRPAMVLWADSDPVLPFKVGEAFADLIGVDAPRKIENASHFLQEDAGEEIGALIADWLA